ncbi:MAG: amylo-alpha-1,6-glucosidase [Leptolyngbyaceae cyanobacterium MO_188.B28]|nr:amylo-alpha-1,6-glucosidase [Leptolyngbyaceae cyanobacterium MO_188.B28]
MDIQFGREICGDLTIAEQREWLVANGAGGYACGTIPGLLSRHYHGLLVAALKPPLGRTLLLTKIDETVHYSSQIFELHTNRWRDGVVSPEGYRNIERFHLEGAIPVWTFACGDALLEKRIWMQTGANTTYVRYTLRRASEPLNLSLKALVNYRDHHHSTRSKDWRMQIQPTEHGVQVIAFANAVPFFLLTDQGEVSIENTWYVDYDLAIERYRGIDATDDHLHAATFQSRLEPGESLTIIASTEANPKLDGKAALKARRAYEQRLVGQWYAADYLPTQNTPAWLEQLVLAADQFIVDRSLPQGEPSPSTFQQECDERSIVAPTREVEENQTLSGKTVIAGYPWFGDWGRDTMISLPGLAIATGRPEIARPILRTFARYLDQGMLPNVFPEAGESPHYNTVDAILWYFEAIRAYHTVTVDDALLQELFPALAEVISWHQQGTRYNIHLDSRDGLIYAGESGVQLTWMDAKIGDWVVTPRIGKPVEINALWYNALIIMVNFAQHLGKSHTEYEELARKAAEGFQQFWNPDLGYCYDVLDGPGGDDASLRPNQIFAVSLPTGRPITGGVITTAQLPPLLSPEQQKAVVDICAKSLLTSYGLRSLAPDHPQYQGQYGGSPLQRDGAYHQGTVWGWLLGPFVQAHLKVYRNPAIARSFLEPAANQLQAGCIGSLSEIFDGDVPITPRGAFAQAWTVAEVLRVWLLTCEGE